MESEDDVAAALNRIATQIKYLGVNDAATPTGDQRSQAISDHNA
jgi:hypothetical protein